MYKNFLYVFFNLFKYIDYYRAEFFIYVIKYFFFNLFINVEFLLLMIIFYNILCI